jgi:N-acetylglucosamine malate deacetylase 1
VTTDYKLDLLAVGAHPDDVELWCGGVVAKCASLGQRVGILDLTRGELGTRGTVEDREREAQAASCILGAVHRENLDLGDGAIGRGAGHSPTADEQLKHVVAAIRRIRPELLLIPYWHERHPDHVEASALLTRAAYFASLQRFSPEDPPCTPRQVIYYAMRYEFTPSFIVDISAVAEKKLAAIRCYSSQLDGSVGDATLLSSELTLSAITARDRHWGAMIGTAAGEAFLVRNTLGVNDPLAFFREANTTGALYFRSES